MKRHSEARSSTPEHLRIAGVRFLACRSLLLSWTGQGRVASVRTHCRSARARRGLGWSAGARCARDSRRRLIGACWHPCRSQQGAGGGRRVRQHARIRRSSRLSACCCRWHRPLWACRNLCSTSARLAALSRAEVSSERMPSRVFVTWQCRKAGHDAARLPGNEEGDEDSSWSSV